MAYNFLVENNDDIRRFFEGDDSYIPTSEIVYLHTRPLLRPNFITEVEDLIVKVAAKVAKFKVQGKPIQDFERYAIELGVAVGKGVDQKSAKTIALALRNVRNLCLELDKNLK